MVRTLSLVLCLCCLPALWTTLSAESWPKAKIAVSRQRMTALTQKSVSRIQLKYSVKCVGTGVAMCGGPIREIELYFHTTGPLTKEELRKMLLAFAVEVQQTAKDIKDLDEYLFAPPFKIENMTIFLSQRDETGRELVHPWFAASRLSNGKIYYQTKDPAGIKRPYLHTETETYEEALEAVRKEEEQQGAQGKQP